MKLNIHCKFYILAFLQFIYKYFIIQKYVVDGLRRSMPNLNRIRGRGGGFGYNGGIARKSGIPATSHRGTKDVSNATSYGLSKIHNSNSRLGNQGSTNSSRMLPPNAIPRIGRNQQGGQHGIPSRGSTTREDKVVVGVSKHFQFIFY